MRDKNLIGRGLAAACILLAMPLVANAGGSSSVGVLSCKAVPGTRLNLIVRSTVDVRCTFKGDGITERYVGETGIALGLDLSFRKDEQFAFTVLSASNKAPGNHALAGKYFGGKASAAAGIGLGAAALVGGSSDSFGLQPLALESTKGVGVAAGIGFLHLEPAK